MQIDTFLQNLRRVLIIDAAHLKGPYLGTMFLVVSMDGNNNIVPIAFRVDRSETADEWTWFLTMLKRCIGEPEGLVFMSDRAASINAAIIAIFSKCTSCFIFQGIQRKFEDQYRFVSSCHSLLGPSAMDLGPGYNVRCI